MFYDAYKRVCEEVGLAETKVLSYIGISKGARAGWMKGTEPNNRTKKQIADYLGITVEELSSGIIKKPEAEHFELSTDEIEMISMYRQLSLNQKAAFGSLLKSIEDKK